MEKNDESWGKKKHELCMPYSLHTGVLESSMMGKLCLGWMFLLIFLGRVLLLCFSCVFALGRTALPLLGGQAD